MRPGVLPLCVLGLGLCNAALSLRICAFNIRSFGEAKANNKRVMGILVKVIARCDLCLIQEVRDAKGQAIPALVRNLNRFDKSSSYAYIESKRLGKKTYKEQYVYIYRTTVVQVKDQYQFPELTEEESNDTEVFSREPFIIRIHSPSTWVKDLVLIGHHTCPKHAMREMEELYGVTQAVRRRWRAENVMVLGDLNAACGYVTVKGWASVRLRHDPKFLWLIGDKEDTTVRENTHCAYDRIIIHGKELVHGTLVESARPFNFKNEFHLSEEEALEVSDHFPVEVELKQNHRYLLRHEL